MKFMKKLSKLIVAFTITGIMMASISVPTYASNKHNVTFIYGTTIYTASVQDGGTVIPPSNTYVPGYIFAGWVGSSVNVKSDVIILGAYVPATTVQPTTTTTSNSTSSSTVTGGKFQVRFKDNLTGQIYSTQTVEYGKSAAEPEKPVHEGYHFARYDGDFMCVTGERTIVAVYHLENSNCECFMHERYEQERLAEQERLRQLAEKEEAERQQMLQRVEQEKQAEQEMLRQLREREEAERQAELERQRRENEAK